MGSRARGARTRRAVVVSLVAAVFLAIGAQAAAAAEQTGAYVYKDYRATLGSGTSSVSASTVLGSNVTGFGQLSNLGTVDFTNASIHFASGAVPDATVAPFAAGNYLFTSQTPMPGRAATISAGFDSSRSFSPGTIPAGSSTQTTTVTIGQPAAALGPSSVMLVVTVDGGPAATGWTPVAIPTGAILSASGTNWVRYGIDASPGDSFTFQVDVVVANNSGGPAPYRPEVEVQQTYGVPASFTGTGPILVSDPDFGDISFAVAEPTPWDVATGIVHTLTYPGLQPASAPQPGYTLTVNPTALTVTSGQTVFTNIAVNGLNGYTGSPRVFLNDNANGPPPAGINQDGPWGSIAADANADVLIQTDKTLAPGDYSLSIGSNDDGGGHHFEAAITLHVIARPDYTLGLDQVVFSVHAGETFTPTATLTPQNGFTGVIELYLASGPGPSQPPPSGFFQNGSYPIQNVGPAAPSVATPIGVSGEVAAGDYTVDVCAYAQALPIPNTCAPILVHVLAALPQAQATALAFGYVNLPGSDDSVANQSYLGERGWRGDLQNFQSTPLPGPRIQLDTVDSTTWTFDPTPTLPADTGVLSDLGQGQQASLHTVAAEATGSTSRVHNTPIVTGYHGSRSMSPASVSAGGAQTETISITLDDPSYAGGFAEIDVFPHDPSSPSNGNVINAASAVTPTLSNGESLSARPTNGDGFVWQINNATVGVIYTLQVPITVATAGVFKPFVIFRGGANRELAPDTGTSTTIHDPELGGTWTYSTAAAGSATFNRGATRVTSTNLQAVVPPIATPDYAVSLDSSEFTVRAGGSVDLGATVTPSGGFTGEVTFWLTTTGVDPNGGWPQPFFQTGPWSVARIPGLDHVTLGLGAPENMPLGDYDLTLGANATGAGIPDKTVRLQVHVVAPLPQARATVYRLAYVNLPSATDSISAGTYAGARGWRGQITNAGPELVSAPTVSALSADPSWSFTPAVTLPVAVGPGADLASGEELRNDAISASGPGSSQVSDTPVQLGYDATRSMSPVSIAAGGGIQNVSVTLTLRSPAYEHGYAAIEVFTHDPSSPGPATIVGGSIHDPALGSGESLNPLEPAAADRYRWAIGNAVLNKPYTLELQIQVPAGSSDYKPFVTVRGGKSDSLPDLDAASTEITDPVLRGAFAFSSGSTVHWSRGNSEVVSTNFSAVDAAPVSAGYAVSLDSSEYTVQAGGSVDLGATVTPSGGFTGEVTFWLTTTGVDPNGGWPQPFFQTAPWSVARIPGLDHVTLGLGAPENMPLGDYDLTLGANATGAGIPDRTVRLQVHVVAPLSAFVTRTGAQLMLDHQPFRAVGMNIYNANSNGWCNFAMDGTLVDDALTSIGNGQTAIRAWFFQQLATTNGQRDWTAFDRTLAAAKAHHVKVIATLVDQWGPCGVTRPDVKDFKDTTWYAQRYKQPDPIGTVSYRDWVQEIAARYKNEPTVLAWQLVNEPEVQPYAGAACDDEASSAAVLQAFAADVSGAIRSVDPNHLISLGTIGSGQCGAQSTDYAAVMSIPTLDLCEFHDYNPTDVMPGDQWNGLATRIEECNALHKPLLVGEIGIKPSDVGGTLADRARAIADKFCAQFSAGVAGALVWNWDSHGSLLQSYEVGPDDPVLALFEAWSDPGHGCAPPTAPRNAIAAAGDGSASMSSITPASDGARP